MPACFSRPYGAAFCAVVLACSAAASAEEPLRVAFEYEAPSAAACPSDPEFRALVTGLLDYEPFVPEAERTVSVEITSSDGMLHGLLRWRNRAGVLEGERRLSAPDADCAKLAQNLAFAVAVQLQLQSAPGADTAGPAMPGGEREVARAEPAPALAPSARPRSSTPSLQFEFGAAGGPFVAVGWSPELALGGNLAFLARGQTLSVQLAFEAILPSDFERDDGSGFQTLVFATSLEPCLRFGALGACSVFRLGQVRVQGFGVDDPNAARGVLAEAGLRLEVSQSLGAGWEGRAHAEVVGTLASRTVQLNGTDVFSAPAVVFLVGIDVAAFFL